MAFLQPKCFPSIVFLTYDSRIFIPLLYGAASNPLKPEHVRAKLMVIQTEVDQTCP